MGVWNTYQNRINVLGTTQRGTTLKREIRTLTRKIPDNLSYTTVTVYDQDHGYNITTEEMASAAYTQNVAIINSDNLDEKYIYSLPGEDIEHGSLLYWMDNYWLVAERDANTTAYTRAKLLQCNHLLKWVSEDGIVIEQWCNVEDGTKYLTGEYEDRNFVTTRGDSRIAVTLAKNAKTSVLGRSNRFLIDDPDSIQKLSYLLTKPLKLGRMYNAHGIYKFVLQEVNSTEFDDMENGIADYYKYYPKPAEGTYETEEPTPGKKVWI